MGGGTSRGRGLSSFSTMARSNTRKQTRKKRGHVSMGHGRIGKHRKHPSGRGNAGGQHHHRIHFDKYHPGYFGKVGMRYFHKIKHGYHCPTINVEKVWSLLNDETRSYYADKKDKAPVVDLVKSGIFKLLGKGSMPEQPIIIKTRFVSKLAEKKVRAAGGAVVLRA